MGLCIPNLQLLLLLLALAAAGWHLTHLIPQKMG